MGHYKIILTDVTDQSALCSTAPPPSTILREELSKGWPVTEKVVQEAARKAQLTIEDAQIWLEHFQTVLEHRK